MSISKALDELKELNKITDELLELEKQDKTESEHQKDFMILCGQPRFKISDLVKEDTVRPEIIASMALWRKLIREEVLNELFTVIDIYMLKKHLLSSSQKLAVLCEIADGIIDSKYVLDGLGNMCGLPMQELFEEVHKANMNKALKDENGKLVVKRRPDGKILKPDGWKEPDIKKIILNHMLNEEKHGK